MNFYLLFLMILVIIGIKIYIIDFNRDYMSKECTSCINGLFILIVLYSHMVTYADFSSSSGYLMLNFRNFLDQLMVTTFLFYSGYGLYYQINKRKKEYINSLPIKRIIKTMLKFFVAVLTFALINILLHKPLTISKVLLSIVGWDTLGNSNWYIFCIIWMYLLTFISFKIIKGNKISLLLNAFLIFIFILLLSKYKEVHWYNTLFCYMFGLLYGYKKDNIEGILFNNANYFISLFLVSIIFAIIRHYAFSNFLVYNVYSVVFIMIIVLITMKIRVNNKYLAWFGKKLFWIYTLQRIPMIIFKEFGYDAYVYRYFLIVFVLTMVLTHIYSFIFDKPIDKLMSNLDNKFHIKKTLK